MIANEYEKIWRNMEKYQVFWRVWNEKAWKNMEIFEKVWKNMEVHGIIWKSMEVFIWNNVEVYGWVCKNGKDCGSDEKIGKNKGYGTVWNSIK